MKGIKIKLSELDAHPDVHSISALINPAVQMQGFINTVAKVATATITQATPANVTFQSFISRCCD